MAFLLHLVNLYRGMVLGKVRWNFPHKALFQRGLHSHNPSLFVSMSSHVTYINAQEFTLKSGGIVGGHRSQKGIREGERTF
jgi:hypothetical protein